MNLKLAVIADLHYRDADTHGTRLGSLADILLLRAIHRLNRLIQPDVTVFLGDMLDLGSTRDAADKRRRLAEIMRRIASPVIVIPGNHDGAADAFYRDFPRPANWLDIRGYRLIPFLDVEAPGYNAMRSEADLQRMHDARKGFDGPIIQLQHTSLFPAGRHPCPYNYTNSEAIVTAMHDAGIVLSLSGHYHQGIEAIATDKATFSVAPALCEPPFAFLEIELQGARATVTRHALQLPPALNLADTHVHTPLAYCSENMDVTKTMSLAGHFGLANVAFAEHSAHLYYGREDYRSGRFLTETAATTATGDRMDQYLAMVRPLTPPALAGLEVDCNFAGQPVLRANDRNQVDFLIGAMHALPSFQGQHNNPDRAADEFLAQLRVFLDSGIAILAHPFRVFRRAQAPVPPRLFAPTVALLKASGVAAEINFHTNEPDPEFFRQCLQAGVKLALGSDAHNLYEIGDFAYHLKFLEQCGFDGDLQDILLPWPPLGA